MKNKELAKMWNSSPTMETAKQILRDFLNEIPRLSKLRNVAKNRNIGVLVSIIDEVLNKWKQLCKLCDGLNPDGLEDVLKIEMTLVMQQYYIQKRRSM